MIWTIWFLLIIILIKIKGLRLIQKLLFLIIAIENGHKLITYLEVHLPFQILDLCQLSKMIFLNIAIASFIKNISKKDYQYIDSPYISKLSYFWVRCEVFIYLILLSTTWKTTYICKSIYYSWIDSLRYC